MVEKRKRKQIYVEGSLYMAEFPHDPTVGWIPGKRGLRRKLGSIVEFKGKPPEYIHTELLRRWQKAERRLRDDQVAKHNQKERSRRDKRLLSVKECAELWKSALEITNTTHTQAEYLRSIRYYIKAVGNHVVSQYEPNYDTEFKRFLKQQKKNTGESVSLATQQKHIRHINAFFAWAAEQEIISKSIKLKNLKIPRKDMQTLDIEQLNIAIRFVKQQITDSQDRATFERFKGLERAMVMARHTILRSGVIWSLKLSNIDLENRIIRITEVPEINWKPKALKFPIKPINDELYQYLKRDLAERGPGEIWYLDNGKGGQWRKQLGNLSREAALVFKELNFPKVKPFHEGFRSTLITHMLLQGVPITTVQQLADHSSIQTTQSYLDTRRIQQKNAVEALASLI